MPQQPGGVTAREREVLLLLAEGLSDVQVAGRLSISPKTVNYHVENLKSRFEALNRTHLIAIALRRRIID
jgi:two-component system, NarL family, nitrate/nitrite response regulator NarL